ncbi:hypothetical protein LPJ66_002316 [Kickxella alabastrina]|uniref:Uncharacterized protein n=1 Tax=Kickxella alabastrina TaxID=61397 RepID=A0ACC1IQT8_9FUNG|nr:hypothetical protein LPJ66_002316 [Kickxella alabastrina]
MSNTSISPTVMLGVLRQLPHMSGKIVDDTRHEKVLSYMQLFLSTSPNAPAHLLGWDFLTTLSQCLHSASDPRISSVSIRFLADALALCPQDLWASVQGHPVVVPWVVDNLDSQHALVRLSCLYFMRKTVPALWRMRGQQERECAQKLMESVDLGRLLVRRLLDTSFFVVAEACQLLCAVSWRDPGEQGTGGVQGEWVAVVERMLRKQYALQRTAHKTAVLSALTALYAHKRPEVRLRALEVAGLVALRPYLFDPDRLVRDRALDVFEAAVRELPRDGGSSVEQSMRVLEEGALAEGGGGVALVVRLRALAALVRAVPLNPQLRERESEACLHVSQWALSLLCQLHVPASSLPACGSSSSSSKILDDAATGYLQALGAEALRKGSRSVSCDLARIVREHSRYSADTAILAQLESLLSLPTVNKWPQLLHLTLECLVCSLRHAATQESIHWADARHLDTLPRLISTFAIRAPGLQMLLALATQVLLLGEPSVDFSRLLVRALGARMADVEWEPRDTVLEFLAGITRQMQWSRCAPVWAALLEDVVGAMGDAEEYVRAAAAHALVAALEHADQKTRRMLVRHPGMAAEALASLLDDSEAFVKRAGLDLVTALGKTAAAAAVDSDSDSDSDRDEVEGSAPWLRCLTYRKLYLLSDHPDFEVRLRCASLLALLLLIVPQYGCNMAAVVDDELQCGSLLLDLCRDPSRYVRRVCLDSLKEMLQQQKNADISGGVPYRGKDDKKENGDAGGGGERKRRAGGGETKEDGRSEKSGFWKKLADIDFARLEEGLSAEHLYQEALDTQVEKELMREEGDVNHGNNILDCY